MCCASMLCYSCTTDPSSSYATCHFLRAGEYSSNTRDTYMKSETTRRGIITSLLSIHTRLHKYTSACRYFCCALCTRLLTAEQSLHEQPHRSAVTSPLKTTFETCCTTYQTVAMYVYCNTHSHC